MKIVEQKYSLSEDDVDLLRGSTILIEMLKHRIIVEFDESPDLENLDMSGCKSFYFIKSLGSKLFQFWFHNASDYQNFRSNLIAYKMSLSKDDDK
jgi:hypothetical protein